MATLFLLILTVLALAVPGLLLPVLWIVTAVVLVIGLLYLWQIGRESVGGPQRE